MTGYYHWSHSVTEFRRYVSKTIAANAQSQNDIMWLYCSGITIGCKILGKVFPFIADCHKVSQNFSTAVSIYTMCCRMSGTVVVYICYMYCIYVLFDKEPSTALISLCYERYKMQFHLKLKLANHSFKQMFTSKFSNDILTSTTNVSSFVSILAIRIPSSRWACTLDPVIPSYQNKKLINLHM